ncbi:DNA recombination protein RmuC [Aminomonas paucivorans]|uniref:DNA recombination protein RmuC n=1 Tax=Aminomonas paucivorans TaxID=81412 RepID=UPI0033261B2A
MGVLLIGGVLAAGLMLAAVFAALGRMRHSSAALEQCARELLVRLQALEASVEKTERTLGEGLSAFREETRSAQREARAELQQGLTAFGETQARRLGEIGTLQKDQLDTFSSHLGELTRMNAAKLDAVRETVEGRLAALQEGNDARLEKMRQVVDEKLHATLEQRLGEAFASVSQRLEKVHQGLGEMKALATDVGDLKKVLSNVKTRGTWGEIQLGNLLEQILAPEQYALNVATRPGCAERVEFAIRLPGSDDRIGPVWLPLDSKFPQEDYLRLVAASEAGDGGAVQTARRQLEQRLLGEGRTIREKYLEPPYTTDFGVLYLPVEGLYAEALRIDGLCERLMREHRVVVAGPTTVAALLNSLQMGFRTLAIEKRSGEVWNLLGQVKTEFGKFGDVLDKTRKKIEEAGNALDGAAVRTRAIERRLRGVEALPSDALDQDLEALGSGEDR